MFVRVVILYFKFLYFVFINLNSVELCSGMDILPDKDHVIVSGSDLGSSQTLISVIEVQSDICR
jgi:hypothetical protein